MLKTNLLCQLILCAAVLGAAAAPIVELTGSSPGSRLGQALCAASDFDGDSLADLVVAAPGSGGGQVTVHFGGPGFPLARTLTLGIESPAGFFGGSVAADRDHDGDGRPDLLVGAPGEGAAYLFSVGAANATRIARIEADEANFGARVALADLDGDTLAELVIAAPGADDATGMVFVYAAPHVPAAPAQAILRGDREGHLFGHALGNAGDAFGRQADALLVGAFGHDLPSPFSGRAYLYAPVDSLEEFGDTVLIHRAEADRDRLGLGVAALGDIDVDGFSDYAISAPTHDAGGLDAGRVYVYRGGPAPSTSPILQLDGGEDDEQLAWSMGWFLDFPRPGDSGLVLGAPMAGNRAPESGLVSLHGDDGRLIREIRGSRAGDRLGFAIVAGYDFDGDGARELVYAAPGANAEMGTVRIEFGTTDQLEARPLSLGRLKSRH